ncbi:MAG: DsbA family protein [Acidimicrobiia bacterium]
MALTFDYMCPFARIANESLIELLERDADLTVKFVPFSLHQNSLEEADTAVWDSPKGVEGRGVRALLWGIAVRDEFPESFQAFHLAVFNARYDNGANINDQAVLGRIAETVGIDPTVVQQIVDSSAPMKTLAAEHTELVTDYSVFGVPTFIHGEEAVFVKMMERHSPDDVAKILDMLTWTDLSEFKRTRVPR